MLFVCIYTLLSRGGIEEVSLGDTAVFSVDHQSLEESESGFSFLAIFSLHVLLDNLSTKQLCSKFC